MVQGQNFTYQSQCEINGTATTTTFVTSSLIQCEVPPGLAGEQRQVRILQNGLYLNFETEFNVEYRAAPYVYEIEPRFALRTNIG